MSLVQTMLFLRPSDALNFAQGALKMLGDAEVEVSRGDIRESPIRHRREDAPFLFWRTSRTHGNNEKLKYPPDSNIPVKYKRPK